MKLDELTIRNIVREEILGKKSVILEDVQRPEDIEGDDGDWDDDDEDERPEDIEGDDGDWDDDDEDPAPAPARQGGGGGCRRPDVGRMQRIFMGEEGNAEEGAKTPNLRYRDDCIWGQYTQAAWIKFLRHYLSDEEFENIGCCDSSGVRIDWGSGGATAASEAIEGKSYQGTPGGALAFVRDLITRGVSEEEEEEELDTGEESPDTDEIEADEAAAEASTDAMGMDPEDVPDASPGASEDSESSSSNFLSIPVQDNEGQVAFTIFVPARSISTDAADRYRDGIAGWALDDFIIDFTQGSERTRGGIPLLSPAIAAARGGPRGRSSVTQGMEDRFIISWGQYEGMTADPTSSSRSAYSNIEYPFSQVTGLRFEDTFPFRRVPDDDPFKVVVRCLEAEKKAARKQSNEIEASWQGHRLGGALLDAIMADTNLTNYQRLIITLIDGTERTLIRPHPRNAALKNPLFRRAADEKYQSCITRTQRRGRRRGADRSDGIDWSVFTTPAAG